MGGLTVSKEKIKNIIKDEVFKQLDLSEYQASKKILEFSNKKKAQEAQNDVIEEYKKHYQALGYTIDEQGVVPKNFESGEDAPDKERTRIWDDAKESPDGTFFIESIEGTPFSGKLDTLKSKHTFTEKNKPTAWKPKKDDIKEKVKGVLKK